jgi:hypothetical protein
MKTCIDQFGQTATVRDRCACTVESMVGIIDAQKARLYGSVWLREVLISKYKACN